MARLAAACVAISVGLVGEPVAHADEVNEQAALRFREGREAMRKEEYATACDKFEESERLDPSAGTVLNLAACAERMGRLVRARRQVELFFGSARPDDDRQANARRLAADLDARIAHLSIRLEPAPQPAARVTVDGSLIEAPERPFAIDPGAHRISVTVPGHLEHSMRVELASGQFLEQSVALVPLGLPASRKLTPAQPYLAPTLAKPPVSPWFYATLGIGVAGTLAVLESSVVIARERSRVDAHCIDKRCDATGLAAGRRGKMYSTINIAAWPVALLGSTLSAYFFLKWKTTAPRARYALGLSLQPQQAAVTFEARVP